MRLRHMDLGIQLLPERGKGSIALPKTGEVLIPLLVKRLSKYA